MAAVPKPKRFVYVRSKFHLVLKFFAVVVCITLFVILMTDVWENFSARMTTTGIQVRL